MIYYHNRAVSHPPHAHGEGGEGGGGEGGGIFGSDYSIFLFYTVHMWLGGLVFCQSFTVATHLFDNPAEKTVGATVMNVLYYVGVCASSIFLLIVP